MLACIMHELRLFSWGSAALLTVVTTRDTVDLFSSITFCLFNFSLQALLAKTFVACTSHSVNV
jgi:hypothetical protein